MGFQKGHPGYKPKGKQPKTLEKEAAREIFNRKVDERWGDLIDMQIKQALIAKNTQERKTVIEQRQGRAVETVTHEGEIEFTFEKHEKET